MSKKNRLDENNAKPTPHGGSAALAEPPQTKPILTSDVTSLEPAGEPVRVRVRRDGDQVRFEHGPESGAEMQWVNLPPEMAIPLFYQGLAEAHMILLDRQRAAQLAIPMTTT